jgi:cellulose synthase (UDP-forming)
MRAMAARHGAGYLRRDRRSGAKAGNINDALRRTRGEFVAVLDCDHVPSGRFLEATLGHLADPDVAMVQTPQYYANAGRNRVAAAAWAQQALFFGAIARGKDGLGAMFCCGTNVVFRRAALEEAGGFPEDSVTEDFELSVHLHEAGWRTAYVPEVLASGLGPEDMASYVSQQQRWARGCLSGLRSALRARIPLRQKAQYALSGIYFLSGWTVLVYLTMPVVRILTGAQPLAGATADQFLIHFAPYYAVALGMVAVAGAGAFTFAGFALATTSFWIHVRASLLALAGRRGGFVVTPKQGAQARQPRAVAPALAAVTVLLGVAAFGLARGATPATINNVAFALFHVSVLLAGAWPALAAPGAPPAAATQERGAPREAALPWAA